MAGRIDFRDTLKYYDGLLEQPLSDALAVGWQTRERQQQLFAEISKVFRGETSTVTLYEVGCGLGDFSDYLERYHPDVAYSGCDINPVMIERAKQRKPEVRVECRDVLASTPPVQFDYAVAIGTMNLKMNADPSAWQAYVYEMIETLYRIARRGIALSFLSTLTPVKEPEDFHMEPRSLLEFLQRLTPFVQIRHDFSPAHFCAFAYRP